MRSSVHGWEWFSDATVGTAIAHPEIGSENWERSQKRFGQEFEEADNWTASARSGGDAEQLEACSSVLAG
jgi:hypothetical protein